VSWISKLTKVRVGLKTWISPTKLFIEKKYFKTKIDVGLLCVMDLWILFILHLTVSICWSWFIFPVELNFVWAMKATLFEFFLYFDETEYIFGQDINYNDIYV
jgi:hypothetical protein